MEDEEFIRKTLEDIVRTQQEIEMSQKGIATAIQTIQKRIKNNTRLEAWEEVQKRNEVRHREWRIKKYGTDEPSFSQLYGGKRKQTVGYDENGSVRVEIPYYTCTCSPVRGKGQAQKHDSGCPFYIMVDQPMREAWMDFEEIAKMIQEEKDGSN